MLHTAFQCPPTQVQQYNIEQPAQWHTLCINTPLSQTDQVIITCHRINYTTLCIQLATYNKHSQEVAAAGKVLQSSYAACYKLCEYESVRERERERERESFA